MSSVNTAIYPVVSTFLVPLPSYGSYPDWCLSDSSARLSRRRLIESTPAGVPAPEKSCRDLRDMGGGSGVGESLLVYPCQRGMASIHGRTRPDLGLWKVVPFHIYSYLDI